MTRLYSYVLVDLSKTKFKDFVLTMARELSYKALVQELADLSVELDGTEQELPSDGTLFTVNDNDDNPRLRAICFTTDPDEDVLFGASAARFMLNDLHEGN